MDRTETTTVEAILRDELARANRALLGVAPIISHMLENSGHRLVSDAIVARLRGMLGDLARHLVSGEAQMRKSDAETDALIDDLADALGENEALLNHLHALATEGYLAEKLEQRASIDPVLSPLLQELIASDQAEVAELAMTALASQARFMQGQRRMEFPIGELPFELFSTVLEIFDNASPALGFGAREERISVLKANYDEGAGRLGLFARLVSSMRGGAIAALELEHAGLALFASGIAALTRQPRDLAVLACHERQSARLALSLRAAGLDEQTIERQFLILQPSALLPHGVGDVPSERAQALVSVDALGVSSGQDRM